MMNNRVKIGDKCGARRLPGPAAVTITIDVRVAAVVGGLLLCVLAFCAGYYL